MRRPTLAVLCLLGGFSLACGGGDNNGGVELPNQMSSNDHTHADKLLKPGEQIRAYYDATIALNGNEAAMVTDQRVVYVIDGRTTDIALADVTAVDHTKDKLTGDVIDVHGTGGQRMRIEIAPFNDGDLFVQILKEATGK